MKGFRLVVPLQVRFRDTDAMGHLNNAVYVTFLEVGRHLAQELCPIVGNKVAATLEPVPQPLRHTPETLRQSVE